MLRSGVGGTHGAAESLTTRRAPWKRRRLASQEFLYAGEDIIDVVHLGTEDRNDPGACPWSVEHDGTAVADLLVAGDRLDLEVGTLVRRFLQAWNESRRISDHRGEACGWSLVLRGCQHVGSPAELFAVGRVPHVAERMPAAQRMGQSRRERAIHDGDPHAGEGIRRLDDRDLGDLV